MFITWKLAEHLFNNNAATRIMQWGERHCEVLLRELPKNKRGRYVLSEIKTIDLEEILYAAEMMSRAGKSKQAGMAKKRHEELVYIKENYIDLYTDITIDVYDEDEVAKRKRKSQLVYQEKRKREKKYANSKAVKRAILSKKWKDMKW